MKYLGIDEQVLIEKGALNTASEIAFQPKLWEFVYKLVLKEQNEIKAFLNDALSDSGKIILTGAGTSAYIGLSLRGSFQRHLGMLTESIATTDMVTHPQDYFCSTDKILLVSFARSGNSPESVASVEISDAYCLKCYHLIITCDKDGALAQYNTKNKKLVVVLPPESNDKSLAMTGSYSGMLLAGLLTANIKHLERIKGQIEVLIKYGNQILSDYVNPLQKIAQKNFSRSVFLGSGPLFGTATESALKLQELTDGSIICKSESYLGFRHGPKAVIDQKSLICYFISNDKHIQNYEYDLINTMLNGQRPVAEIAVCEGNCLDRGFDLLVKLSTGEEVLEEEFLSVCYILPGQILAFYKSLSLGYKTDNPSVSGAISRVVEGVIIYHKNN